MTWSLNTGIGSTEPLATRSSTADRCGVMSGLPVVRVTAFMYIGPVGTSTPAK